MFGTGHYESISEDGERRAFRGTFNLRQDRGWVNDGLKTTKRRLEDDCDEGSLVSWYQLSRQERKDR